jgi:hypothetical protein
MAWLSQDSSPQCQSKRAAAAPFTTPKTQHALHKSTAAQMEERLRVVTGSKHHIIVPSTS